MRIKVVPEHALTRDIDRAIGALMDIAFEPGAGYDGRSYHKTRHHLRVMGWDGDHLIGHVALQLRAIRMGGAALTIAGVGEVAVHPGHQGHGRGTALMREAITAVEGGIAAFAVLFGHPGLYAPLGFQPQPNRLRHVAWGDGRPTRVVTDEIGSLMVLPLGTRHWDAAAEIDLCGPLF